MGTFLFMIPHPDDEILACTYWLKYVINHQLPCKIIFFTDGENDLIGEMLAFCERHVYQLPEMYISVSVKMMLQNGKVQNVYMIRVMDLQKKPVSTARVTVCRKDQCKSLLTNELGWVCAVTPGSLTSITVNDTEIPKTAIMPVTREFHDAYGDMRFQESLRALKTLGIQEEHIVRLRLRDGSVFKYCTGSEAPLKKTVSNLLAEAPGGTVIIPHEQDIDDDHKAISEVVQSAVSADHTVCKYIVHSNFNHKVWPNPPYISHRADRLRTERMLPPLKDTPYLDLNLTDVQFSGENKLALLKGFQTQMAADEYGFLIGFAKDNEIYYTMSGG